MQIHAVLFHEYTRTQCHISKSQMCKIKKYSINFLVSGLKIYIKLLLIYPQKCTACEKIFFS